MIKSYYDDNHLENFSLFISIDDFLFIEVISLTKLSNMSQSNNQFGISNNQKSKSEIFSDSSKRDRDRSRKYFASIAFLSFVFNAIVDLVFVSSSLFALAVVFKLDSIVHIVLFYFVAFRQKKINELIEKNVFQSINKNDVSTNVCIFNSRFIDEIKHFDIDKAFEKSRLVMQTFNDQNKNLCYVIICKKRSLSSKNMFDKLISFFVASRVMTTSSSRA